MIYNKMEINNFEDEIIKRLKERDIGETSITLYLKNIRRLNNNNNIINFNFLKHHKVIEDKLKDYKENTRKTYYISIGSSMLRNIYLTSKYSNTQNNLNEDVEKMGTSVFTAQNNYIKTDL